MGKVAQIAQCSASKLNRFHCLIIYIFVYIHTHTVDWLHGVAGPGREAAPLVAEVHDFPGHIACDSASQSELALPVMVNRRLRAVFDLDSPKLARFDEEDARGLGRAIALLTEATDWD